MVNIEEEHFSYLLNDCRGFNEIFRKNMNYDNIGSHKKNTGLHPLSTKQKEEGFLYSLKTSGNLRSN